MSDSRHVVGQHDNDPFVRRAVTGLILAVAAIGAAAWFILSR